MSGLARFECVSDVVVQHVSVAQGGLDPLVLQRFLGGRERSRGAYNARATRVAQVVNPEVVDSGCCAGGVERLSQCCGRERVAVPLRRPPRLFWQT